MAARSSIPVIRSPAKSRQDRFLIDVARRQPQAMFAVVLVRIAAPQFREGERVREDRQRSGPFHPLPRRPGTKRVLHDRPCFRRGIHGSGAHRESVAGHLVESGARRGAFGFVSLIASTSAIVTCQGQPGSGRPGMACLDLSADDAGLRPRNVRNAVTPVLSILIRFEIEGRNAGPRFLTHAGWRKTSRGEEHE